MAGGNVGVMFDRSSAEAIGSMVQSFFGAPRGRLPPHRNLPRQVFDLDFPRGFGLLRGSKAYQTSDYTPPAINGEFVNSDDLNPIVQGIPNANPLLGFDGLQVNRSGLYLWGFSLTHESASPTAPVTLTVTAGVTENLCAKFSYDRANWMVSKNWDAITDIPETSDIIWTGQMGCWSFCGERTFYNFCNVQPIELNADDKLRIWYDNLHATSKSSGNYTWDFWLAWEGEEVELS